MFESLTISEVTAFLIAAAAAGTAIAFLTKPVRALYGRLSKLERAVFDEHGKVKFPAQYAFDDVVKNTTDIKNAVNMICDAMMAILDSEINGDNIDELRAVKAQLQKERGIV